MKFSDDQLQQLKDIFATKDDLKKSLSPLRRGISAMRKDLNWVMGKYDIRLNHLEKHFVHPPGRADN